MAKIYGQLERAQVENLSSDPSPGIKGRVFFNTSSGQFKFDDGTSIKIVTDNTTTADDIAAAMTSTGTTSIAGTMTTANANTIGGKITTAANTIAAQMTSTGSNAIAASMSSTGTGSIVATATAANANTLDAKRTRAATTSTVTSPDIGYLGIFSLSAAGTTLVDSSTITITTSGRPVMICLVSSGNEGYVESHNDSSTTSTQSVFLCKRDATTVGTYDLGISPGGTAASRSIFMPASVLQFFDNPVAGTYVYKLQIRGFNSTDTANIINSRLIVYEL